MSRSGRDCVCAVCATEDLDAHGHSSRHQGRSRCSGLAPDSALSRPQRGNQCLVHTPQRVSTREYTHATPEPLSVRQHAERPNQFNGAVHSRRLGRSCSRPPSLNLCEPSPGADVTRSAKSTAVQMWHGCAQSRCRCDQMGQGQSRCRCGTGGPSPGADVGGLSPVRMKLRRG